MVVPAAVRACVGARGGVCVPTGKAPAYRVEGSMVCTASLGDAPPAVGASGARVPVMALYGEHARELISSEVALRLAAMLCSAAAQRSASAFWGAAARSASARQLTQMRDHHRKAVQGLTQYELSPAWVEALLRRITLKFIPVENLNARRLVEANAGGRMLCHRMNANHPPVDINRNYDNHFGVHAPEYLPAEEYEGVKAYSEPETRITHDVAAALQPLVFVSIHSGIREMYLPYDWQSVEAPGADLHEVLAAINKKYHLRDISVATEILD
jgi:hypothetical protein